METIGERIRELRVKNRITQKELAEKLNIHPSILTRIEKNTRAIKNDEIEKIAQLFNVTTDYLLTGKAEETEEDKFINLLIQKTLDGKIKWIDFDDSDNIMIKFENGDYSPAGIKNLLSNYVDLYALTNLKFTSINKLIIYLVAEYYDPLKTTLKDFTLLYGKNSKKIKVIDCGNKYLKELYQVVFENDEYLGKMELSAIISDLENL